jgi:hypothetical protein
LPRRETHLVRRNLSGPIGHQAVFGRSGPDASTVNAAYRHHDIDRLNDGFLMAADPLTWRIGSCSLKFIDPVGGA